jgi:acyl-coenzyme A synthetase/AMP-(fatty) acid ligase
MGYYNDPTRTDEAFVQNPLQNAYPERVYRTGDLAYRNARGELVFVCRRDAQIKHMGHRIELGEIEAAAQKCDGVSRACCLYDSAESRIKLFYAGNTEKEALTSYLREHLPKYMMPGILCHLPTLPLTPNGKIDRRKLAEMIV